MNIIMICIFGGLTALLLVQIRNIIYYRRSTKGNSDNSIREQYSSHILERSEKAMCAVMSGRIKKQLIENDAPLYDSYDAMRQYVNFIENSVAYKKILSLKGSRYDG